MSVTFQLSVNGKTHSVEADPATPLLYVLRNQLMLNGPKYGCGVQQCGACMVLLNGHAIPSCAMPISAVKDQPVVTLEGLAKDDDTLHPVQPGFIEEQSAQ
jgi:Aerobic-type carbon monoxide dehydrogenase, small subunit CoxS/CutS homologs